jgi:hypothetical protein
MQIYFKDSLLNSAYPGAFFSFSCSKTGRTPQKPVRPETAERGQAGEDPGYKRRGSHYNGKAGIDNEQQGIINMIPDKA